jgi:fatty acid desaturase
MQNEISSPRQIRSQLPSTATLQLHKVSTFKGLLSILQEWLIIIGIAWICEMYFSWPLYLLAVVIIGARLLALGLIMHEAVHNLISKNTFINDWSAEIFCSWPLLVSMRSYKAKHLAHHAWLNTEKDPDFIAKFDKYWRFPMQLKQFIKLVLTQISGLGIFKSLAVMSSQQMKSQKAKIPTWYRIIRILYYVSILFLFIYLGKGLILLKYWLIPFLTWTQVANRFRRIAEHSGINGKNPSLTTRTTIHGFLGRFLLAPKNISYHNEHHLYPGIPCYNLPKMHNEIMKNEDLKSQIHVSNSYKEVFEECIIK